LKTTHCNSDEIHIWRASLDNPPVNLVELHSILSKDERQRSHTYHFERDARRFVTRRGLLRILLSQYCQQAPQDLQFHYNEYGKPFLTLEASLVSFSVSHSEGIGFYAVASGRGVGVDVECLRPLDHMEEIVLHYFSPPEQIEFCQAPPALKPETFFSFWTRKEAYIKAKGQGLSYPLQEFAVTDLGQGSSSWIPVADRSDPGTEWGMRDLAAPAGFKAALAAEGKDWAPKVCEF
jgi:4'-phosphopantetheinyl transferase